MSPPATPIAPAIHWRLRQQNKRLSPAQELPLLKAAVAAAPDRLDLKLKLARTLIAMGGAAELVGWLEPNGDCAEMNEELLYHIGRAALMTDDGRLACRALENAAARGFGLALSYYAEALYHAEREDEALEAGLRGLARSAADFKSLSIVSRILLRRGQAQRLWDLCATLRQRGGSGGYIPAAMAMAASSPEQCRQVKGMVDPARWFSAEQLSIAEHFNERLSAELLGHQSLAALPAVNATDGTGRRINDLDVVGGELSQRLLLNIRKAVERYAIQRASPASDAQNFAGQFACLLNSWAIAVWRDGHETWHVHPGGWLSGVYYVAVPNGDTSADDCAGSIEFGPFPFGEERDVAGWPRWRVQPRPGLLLLFPSWYPHRSWPTGSSEPRICVAFDVVAEVSRPCEVR